VFILNALSNLFLVGGIIAVILGMAMQANGLKFNISLFWWITNWSAAIMLATILLGKVS
jgi:hypothetical protein